MQHTMGCRIVTQASLLPLITSLHILCAHAYSNFSRKLPAGKGTVNARATFHHVTE